MNTTTAAIANLDDYVNTTVIFGEIKKTIISKDFRGGKVHIVFGTTELDFTYADISGLVVLDISQAFAETKIIVPKDWRVQTDMTHFCSAEEDHRKDVSQIRNTDKILVITGMSAFAAVEINHCI